MPRSMKENSFKIGRRTKAAGSDKNNSVFFGMRRQGNMGK